MYRTIVFFTDLEDNGHSYYVGDIYPRAGLKPTADRIKELSTSANKRKIPLIEKIEEELPKRERKAKNDD